MDNLASKYMGPRPNQIVVCVLENDLQQSVVDLLNASMWLRGPMTHSDCQLIAFAKMK